MASTDLERTGKPLDLAFAAGERFRGPGFLPRWLKRFAGRRLQSACRSVKLSRNCDDCHLRALCRCAYEDFLADAAVERWWWIVLAGCGGAVILYAVLALLGRT